MTRAAIYARQSIDLTEGIDRQLSRCAQLIAARGWALARDYRDNDTSASKDRSTGTAWAEMLADIRRGLIDVVVAVDIDRLLRSVSDLVTLTQLGAKVLTVDGEVDLTTADGEFRATMLAGIAQFETRRKGERQRRANDARTASGKPVPGRRRYGYEGDNCTPREPEASDVRALYRDFLAGASVRSLSLARGWRPLRVRETLTNEAYTGCVVHKGIAYPSGFVTSLVSRDDFDAAGAILSDPARTTTPGPTVKHLASNVAVCGVCNARLVYMRSYRCKKSSAHPSILKDTLDRRIREAVIEAFLTGRVKTERVAGNATNVKARLSDLQLRRARATELAMVGGDMVTIKRTLSTITAEEDQAKAELDVLLAASVTERIIHNVVMRMRVRDDNEQLTYVARSAAEVGAAWDALSIADKRELLRGLMSVTVQPGRSIERVHIEFTSPGMNHVGLVPVVASAR